MRLRSADCSSQHWLSLSRVLPPAELTRFGDRRFYDDWWASTSFSEFSRRWNRPVHEFFLRHAYLDGMRRWGLRPAKALAATFLISIIMHEAIIYAALEGPPPWLALMR